MQNEITILTENDNIFEYLGDEITTVASVLESIYFNTTENELTAENKATVLALNNIHYYNDDFFNLLTNEVLTKEKILEKHDIKVFDYDLENSFKIPKSMMSSSIMEVFKYDLKKSV